MTWIQTLLVVGSLLWAGDQLAALDDDVVHTPPVVLKVEGDFIMRDNEEVRLRGMDLDIQAPEGWYIQITGNGATAWQSLSTERGSYQVSSYQVMCKPGGYLHLEFFPNETVLWMDGQAIDVFVRC